MILPATHGVITSPSHHCHKSKMAMKTNDKSDSQDYPQNTETQMEEIITTTKTTIIIIYTQ